MLELKEIRGAVVWVLAFFAEGLRRKGGWYWLWRNIKQDKIYGG